MATISNSGPTNIGTTSTSNYTDNLDDYSVDARSTEGPADQFETAWTNTKATQWFGYYKTIPELKKAIDFHATWCVGQGYTADPETQVILEHITGWGEDTFNSICWNMVVNKKIYGDAFAEIIRDPESGELINLKVLDPASIKIVVDRKGILKRYEQVNKTGLKNNLTFEPKDILHLCNDRVADEIHGTSVIEACEWIILARNEAMDDYRKVLHRNVSPLKIVHLDTDNQTKINTFISMWEKTVKDKETIFIPKGNVEVEIPNVQLQEPTGWIRYLENFFYVAVGVPKVIVGGSEEFTEASSKIAYLSYEMQYKREQSEFEKDFWNQVQLKIKFETPVSLKNEMLQSEQKQPEYGVGMQQSETQPGKNE